MRHVEQWLDGYVVDFNSINIDVIFENDLTGEILISTIPPEEQKYIKHGAIFTITWYNDDTYDFTFSKECWTEKQIAEI